VRAASLGHTDTVVFAPDASRRSQALALAAKSNIPDSGLRYRRPPR